MATLTVNQNGDSSIAGIPEFFYQAGVVSYAFDADDDNILDFVVTFYTANANVDPSQLEAAFVRLEDSYNTSRIKESTDSAQHVAKMERFPRTYSEALSAITFADDPALMRILRLSEITGAKLAAGFIADVLKEAADLYQGANGRVAEMIEYGDVLEDDLFNAGN